MTALTSSTSTSVRSADRSTRVSNSLCRIPTTSFAQAATVSRCACTDYGRDPDKTGLLHYAQFIVSTKGKRDGLYFETKADEPESPFGSLFAKGRSEGYAEVKQGQGAPYHGYHYRVLKAQGPHANGGAYDYLAKGKMMGGFALVAYPATRGSSGVMTFLVNHDGVVYQKDLGPKTAAIAQAMTKFDPDDTWKPVSDQDQEIPTESAQ
jgi:hypothetical protein